MPIRTFVNNVRVSREKTGKDFSQFMDELKDLVKAKEVAEVGKKSIKA